MIDIIEQAYADFINTNRHKQTVTSIKVVLVDGQMKGRDRRQTDGRQTRRGSKYLRSSASPHD